MTDLWLVTIEAWPHSTGKGADNDQKSAGERSQNLAVHAEGMAAALEIAEAIAQGIRTNPMVWRAPIVAIVQGQERQRQIALMEKPRFASCAKGMSKPLKPEDRDWSAL